MFCSESMSLLELKKNAASLGIHKPDGHQGRKATWLKAIQDNSIFILDFKSRCELQWEAFHESMGGGKATCNDGGEHIFSGLDGDTRVLFDSKRKQQPLAKGQQALLESMLEASGVLEGGTFRPSNPVTLLSTGGGTQQAWHVDLQRGLLIALVNDTFLLYKDAGGKAFHIALKAGEGVVFGKECVHAGAGYEIDNMRVHVYLLKEGEVQTTETGDIANFNEMSERQAKLPMFTPPPFNGGM